jgi:hypothetical protein
MFMMSPVQAIVAREQWTFRVFLPRQKPGGFSVGDEAGQAPQ